MDRQKRFIVGIDVGGTNIKIGLIDSRGKIHRKLFLSTKKFPQKDKLIDALATHVKMIIGEGQVGRKDILGIGIGAPGLIDSEGGIIHYLVNIKGFKEVPLKKIIETRLKIPAYLDNDANVVCLGELCYGSGRGSKNMICITLGTGVGGGIVIGGSLYRGSSLSAGEVGHITINEQGPRCGCGNSGCMEAYVGNSYIEKDAVRKVRKNKKSLMYQLANGDLSKITPKVISAAARRGDRLAIGILKKVGERIGVGLANIINILNPDRIVIGGGVAESGKILFDAIKKSIQKRAMKMPAKAVRIVKSELGADAGLKGAAALAMLARNK